MPLITYPPHALTDMLFDALIRGPGELNYTLRENICRYGKDIRRNIVSQYRDETTPLFLAVSGGWSDDIVRFLVKDCNADVEQKCRLRIQDNEGNTFSTHVVTALWCASVKGCLSHARMLFELGGANLNTTSDSGSTPIRSACFMNKIDVVSYLISAGADVNRPNYNGGTCLINSVQNTDLCKLLIKSGANVNAQDMHGKTAAHYSIQENRLDTLKLFVEIGEADVTIQNSFGDDLIQTASLNAIIEAFEYLACNTSFSLDYILNQYDLLGAGVLEKYHDLSAAIRFWGHSLSMRQESGIKKEPKPKHHCLKEHYEMEEIESYDELQDIRTNGELMHLQALLIYERVLGSNHRETIFRLLYRGAVYADQLEFQNCLYIWIYVYEIKLANDVIYNPDTVFTCRTICIVLMEMTEKFGRGQISEQPKLSHLIRILFPIQVSLPFALECLRLKPSSIVQENFFKKSLLNLLYLLHASSFVVMDDLSKAGSESQDFVFKKILYQIVKENPLVTDSSTLLHLSIDNNSFLYYHPLSIIPSLKVVRLLTEVGANVNARNDLFNTPLHLISTNVVIPQNYVTVQIMKTLLRRGAHYDARNKAGQMAGVVVQREPITYELRNVNLKCLASRVIRHNKKLYDSLTYYCIPENMLSYVEIH